MKPRPLCIFCDNRRTNKRGEHVWDDWLNRFGGKEILERSTTSYFGAGGRLIRKHPSNRIDVTLPVVCNPCNNEWMSDISTRAKDILEPSIRRDEPREYDADDIVTLAAFIFLKAAVLEWGSSTSSWRAPCILRSHCVEFRESLTTDTGGDVAFPTGLQIWVARYRRRHTMEAQALSDELVGRKWLRGYRILLVTYLVGSFIFQLTVPRWSKMTRNRPTPPFLEVIGDVQSVPIWPEVTAAYWPPLQHVDSSSLEDFRQRFRRVRRAPTGS